jgi:7-cyano-7-deazaguanine synthase
MRRNRAVTLLSGGIDSMVLCDLLLKEKGVSPIPLFVNYGQRANGQEYRAALAYSKGRLKIHKVSVTPKGVPLYSQLITGKLSDKAFLPGRNLLLLLAAAWKACELRTAFIAIGLRDVAAFPDTSDIFVRSFSNLSYMAFGRTLTVLAPLINFSKQDVVNLGRELGTKLSVSYSCYLGRSKPCGRCLGCKDRKVLLR